MMSAVEWWISIRREELHVLREEQSYGMRCFRVKGEQYKGFPEDLGWRAYCPWMGPTFVQINYDLPRSRRLGRALSHFGTLEELNVGQGDPHAIGQLFETLGEQPGLHSIYMYGVKVNDDFCLSLSRYPRLANLEISPSDISGEQMPTLPRLVYLNLTPGPVTNAGFRRLLALPALNQLDLEGTDITLSGLKELLHISRAPAAISISGAAPTLNDEDILPIVTDYRKKWPKARLDVSNPKGEK